MVKNEGQNETLTMARAQPLAPHYQSRRPGPAPSGQPHTHTPTPHIPQTPEPYLVPGGVPPGDEEGGAAKEHRGQAVVAGAKVGRCRRAEADGAARVVKGDRGLHVVVDLSQRDDLALGGEVPELHPAELGDVGAGLVGEARLHEEEAVEEEEDGEGSGERVEEAAGAGREGERGRGCGVGGGGRGRRGGRRAGAGADYHHLSSLLSLYGLRSVYLEFKIRDIRINLFLLFTKSPI